MKTFNLTISSNKVMELCFSAHQLNNYCPIVFDAIVEKIKSDCFLFVELHVNSAKCTSIEEFHKHIQYLNNVLIENTSFYIQMDQVEGGTEYILSVFDSRKSVTNWEEA
jgi:hypothetical protein